MAKKIYVGNMNYATNEQSLRDLFAQFGEVRSVNIIMDRYTGQAKGFGFIEMEADDAADSAINALNGREFEGRTLRVNQAMDRDQQPRRDYGNDHRY
jgi:RNA recognition motif-containing protein